MAQLTRTPEQNSSTATKRRYTDPPALWYSVAASSLAVHLLLLLGVRVSNLQASVVQADAAPVSVELIEIAPEAATAPAIEAPSSPPSAATAPQPVEIPAEIPEANAPEYASEPIATPQPNPTTQPPPDLTARSTAAPDQGNPSPQPSSPAAPQPTTPAPTPPAPVTPTPTTPADPNSVADPAETTADATAGSDSGNSTTAPDPGVTEPQTVNPEPTLPPLDPAASDPAINGAPTASEGLPAVTVEGGVGRDRSITSLTATLGTVVSDPILVDGLARNVPDAPAAPLEQEMTQSFTPDAPGFLSDAECQFSPEEIEPALGEPLTARIYVTWEGQAEANVTTPSGNEAYDRLVSCFIKQWAFTPAMQGGQPVDNDDLVITIAITRTSE